MENLRTPVKQKIADRAPTPFPPENLNMSIEEESMFDIKERELSAEEIMEKNKQKKEIEQKMKELEEEKEKIDSEIGKEKKIKNLYEFFKSPRTKFVFKVSYDDGIFRESCVKNYFSVVVKKICDSETKIIKWKILNDYVWFETDKPVLMKWVQRQTEAKDNLTRFTIFQLRPDCFFEYI